MGNVTVIGAQWGDEGKGKIVDWLASRADMVVRFQGGHNAGHTLVVGDQTYKLSLLPSGIVRGTPSVIGNGVVLDPWALKAEVERIREQGVDVTPEVLMVAETCPLILPIHRDLDALREDASGAGKIGTTRRGIGPAYEDKVGRRAIRVCDLARLDDLDPLLDRLCAHHDALRAGFKEPPVDRERLRKDLAEIAEFVLPFARPVWRDLDVALRKGKRVLFEGAQGVLLDVDHGTYPFVTSSNTVAGTTGSGSGIGPSGAGFVLGIVKAYTTRVGSGPFPTEQDNEVGQKLGERGHEFGTVTGRRRRCGWFDAVLVRQAVAVSGITGVALTKLDVLDGFETLKICTGYKIDGKKFDYLPPHSADQARVEPVFQEIEGWDGSTRGARSWADLAGAGGQICPPHRRADPLPGRAGQHLARTRRHDPGPRPVRGLVPHLEAAEALRLRIFDHEIIDPRVRGAAAHPVDHSSDGLLLARQMRFDRAVRTIADPAADPELAGMALSPGAEKDALHQTRRTDVPADQVSHLAAPPRPSRPKSHRRDVGCVLGLHSDDVVARIDMMDLARHSARQVGQQVQPGPADVLDRHVAAKRRIIFVPLHDVAEVADAAGGQGLDRPGGDGVYANAFGPEVHRQIFDRGFERGLGDAHHVVMRDHLLGAVIGQGEHRSAGLHHRACALGDRDEAVDRDVHGHQEIVDAGVDELSAKLILVRIADRVDDEVHRLPLAS